MAVASSRLAAGNQVSAHAFAATIGTEQGTADVTAAAAVRLLGGAVVPVIALVAAGSTLPVHLVQSRAVLRVVGVHPQGLRKIVIRFVQPAFGIENTAF